MSSTNRNADRNEKDYYITPKKHVELFWNTWLNDHPMFDRQNAKVLDPSAGGCPKNPDMPYPTVLQPTLDYPIYTMDIRNDSSAIDIENYLSRDLKWNPDLIITNPPFNISMEFIEKAVNDIAFNGYVIMLQKLNFMGTKLRYGFFKNNMPVEIYIHSQRMGFIPNSSKTDSIEYAHFVWQKSNPDGFSKTYLIR